MNKTIGSGAQSDALVLFGVTGDLAYKKIFPALYAMAKRGVFNVPVIGVATSKWSSEQLRQWATESIKKSGKIDDQHALNHLLSLLSYVSGDYNVQDTFTAIKKALGSARRTTSPYHPRYSRPSSRGSAMRAWPTMRALSSKNRSVATWPLHANLTTSRSRYFQKTRSSVSITISAKRPS